MLRRFLILLLFVAAASASAHDGLEVEPPVSDAEAWNTINLCRANIDTLIASQQWLEVPVQAALCNQALRYLREHAGPTRAALVPKFYEAEEEVIDLFSAASRNDGVRTSREAQAFAPLVEALSAAYDPAVAKATIFACPMCRGIRELDPKKPCFKCGMALVPRIIPASSVYNTPGEPSIALLPVLDRPLQVGHESVITLTLQRKKDHAPVPPADLLVVHTERIHLLIVDESLTDYHHEHPLPTGKPGEYTFRLTPRLLGPYRVFADLVPALSNVQEYASCTLTATGTGEPPRPASDTTRAEVAGLRYDLAWAGGPIPLRARQPVRATVQISDIATGTPFKQLEPIMGTFAHVVAFHEDHQTVLHIHPLGEVPKSADDRGGPAFTFQFYAPKAGLYHLFAQVQVNGESRFAPFIVNVAE